MLKLSGWRRFGVCASVVWLVAFPTLWMAYQNSSANKAHSMCLRVANERIGPSGWAGSKPDELKTAQDKCAYIFQRMHVPFEKLLRLLSGAEGTASLIFLMVLLGPLVICWIVVGGTLVTVRWVHRSLARNAS